MPIYHLYSMYMYIYILCTAKLCDVSLPFKGNIVRFFVVIFVSLFVLFF